MAQVDLFTEMESAADALRASNPNLRVGLADDLQILFREIQKARRPELSKEEWLELFNVWLARYAAKMQAERDATLAKMKDIIETAVRINPTSPPFRCVCGATTTDPSDLAFMAVHVPHCVAAGEARERERKARQR
jgi:hypothetical protein